MRPLVLLLSLLSLAAAPPEARPKAKAPPRHAATKVSTGKEICRMMERIAKAGVPAQTDIDVAAGQNVVVQGKVGAIGKDIGTFHVANLYLRGMARGSEGFVYKDKCLKIDFPDLDRDGVRDLEVSATIERLDPKADPPLQGTQEYRRTFLYHPDLKTYQAMEGSPNPIVELVVR